jgi:hypothetical protein
MPERTITEHLRGMTIHTRDEAIGRRRRRDPIRPRTGGPAGNATLTAWTGLLLLALFLAELVTLLDVHGLITWHIALGALLIPPSLLKTATTGWRIVRYYLGDRGYVSAGPPPTPLRLLGPVVVLSTLAVLGTGLALILIGQQASRQTFATVLGQRVDPITLHQESFILWAVATGLHALARLFPAVQTVLQRGRALPGRWQRGVVLGVVAVLAALTAVLVVRAAGDWQADRFDHRSPAGVDQPGFGRAPH